MKAPTRIAHVGPPRARTGGPAGYLWELARVAAPEERFLVTFPDEAAPRAPEPSPSWRQRGRGVLGKLKRRVLGPPDFRRHTLEELLQPEGVAANLLTTAETVVLEEAAPSLEAALPTADVLFAHDAWTADLLLTRRRPGQEVWLFVHAPFPLGVFQVWSFGRPDLPWQMIADLPDVRASITRELGTFRKVDRLILPCLEAGDEFLRFDPRFSEPLADALFLPTGACGPERRFPTEDRAALRRRFGLPETSPVGLFFGNDQPYRGLDALLAALPGLEGGAGVVAVAGPARERLPAHPRLVALGRVAAVADLLAAVDFVINVNRFSLFDLSTIEALAAGCPLLLHATGGNRTFVSLGAGCRSFTGLEPETIARELVGLFGLAPEERNRLAEASARTWTEHLTPERWWQRHVELYADAVRRRSETVPP